MEEKRRGVGKAKEPGSEQGSALESSQTGRDQKVSGTGDLQIMRAMGLTLVVTGVLQTLGRPGKGSKHHLTQRWFQVN